MDVIDEPPHGIDGGLGEDTVAEVKEVAGPSGSALEHIVYVMA